MNVPSFEQEEHSLIPTLVPELELGRIGDVELRRYLGSIAGNSAVGAAAQAL
jgi:hypothetical protein